VSSPQLDADEIDHLTDAELVAAVDGGRIAADEIGYALALAAEKRADGGDVEGALLLADRAVAADPDAGWIRAGRAGLFAKAGRSDDALAAVTELRPRLLTDALAPSYVRETLQELGRGEDAERWLTEALTEALSWGEDIDEERAGVAYQLAVQRHELRHELDLGHDELDDMAEELISAAEAEAAPDGSVVMFWPREEFEALRAKLPAVAESEGSSWDEHRAGIEVTLSDWAAGGTTGLAVVAGSVEELIAHAATTGGSPDDDETIDDYVGSLDPGRAVEWPPPRNGPCWCGSGLKYKKCCLPRSRS
jgi:tetratricopeptide (TPR) repeat protein